jgi:hypothetical protein
VPKLSRRQLLVRGGVLAGTLTFSRVPAAALAARAGVLSAGRRRTYRALVAALAASPDGRCRHADSGRAARAFAEWYAGQPPTVRAHVDGVLDGLGAWWDGSYAGLTRSAAGADPARAATIASAMALAARTTEPPPSDADDRSVALALLAA